MVILKVALCSSFVSGYIYIYIKRDAIREFYFLGSALNNVFLLQCNTGVGYAKEMCIFASCLSSEINKHNPSVDPII